MTPNGMPDVAVRFEGFGTGTEILGGIQGNFLVAEPGTHAKEVAVILNDPALDFLLDLVAQERSDGIRRELTRRVGELWLAWLARSHRPIDPVIFLSRSRMEMAPGFVDEVCRYFRAAGGPPEPAGDPSPAH